MEPLPKANVTRRSFLHTSAAAFGALALAGAPSLAMAEPGDAENRVSTEDVERDIALIAAPDPENSFGVDLNVNIATIDRYLHRSDVAYRDMRMLDDPADFAAIGGNSELDFTLEGFRITPFPYFVSMPALVVDGVYDGPCLFDVEWGEDNRSILSVRPNYRDSLAILKELFPQHKKIFLMCGGGGYAGMMRVFLLYLGWDPDKVFNVGGAWDYSGSAGVYLISYDEAGKPTYRRWRADYTLIEFEKLASVDSEEVQELSDDRKEALTSRSNVRKCIVA